MSLVSKDAFELRNSYTNKSFNASDYCLDRGKIISENINNQSLKRVVFQKDFGDFL